ncbi:adhesion G-protein coupled receptor F3 isoform X2 [Fundulus heteroclitus]|uniref:adhesion G-protein coupled receptor F3 isoform X2 n=1 Tax=Fundulus heteroclitus TaxID=8078 RepID=UPI00165BEEB5|nr:adhesion G-protein coupled receptor F3 isoform X2 [Fundulus heteroclitus]
MKEKLSRTNLTNQSAIEDFLFSSSHLLNESLASSWNATTPEGNSSFLAENYLLAVEKLIERSEIIGNPRRKNLEVDVCNTTKCNMTVFDAKVSLKEKGVVKTAGFQNLQNYLPYDNKSILNSIIVSTTAETKTNISITIDFTLLKPRPRNVMLHCVFWNTNIKNWSTDGCEWQGADEVGRCVCTHLSSFSILMSKEPIEVPGLTYLTYAALSVSVVSLIISLVIELIVWSEVVKTSTLYLRHTAHVNISLCLLIADLCFLASSQPKGISELWCRTSAVLKHFCYLAMFFWMFCLSATLLHQAVFLFHKVSKKNYLRFSLVIGYVCPLLIVFITFVTNDGGSEGKYFLKESCWLVYDGMFKGTIFTFIIPVGAIVFINVFSMLVVIMKLISHHSISEVHKKNDISPEKEKTAAKIVVRSVILLTPIFGVTWIFGFAILIIDLTEGTIALAVNYIFTALNGFQGFFILLTTCLGDRMTREALRKYLRKKAPASSVSESTTKSELTWKK